MKPFMKPAQEYMKKRNKQIFWGTWDSNPGPNDHTPMLWPTELHVSIIIKTKRNYYMGKQQHMPEKNIKHAIFEMNE